MRPNAPENSEKKLLDLFDLPILPVQTPTNTTPASTDPQAQDTTLRRPSSSEPNEDSPDMSPATADADTRTIPTPTPPRRSQRNRRPPIRLDLFEYGAYCPTPEPLTGELLDFVSDPQSKGTILVAFGTVINWARVPRKKFDAILDTLNSLTDYRIVWAYNGLPLNTKPHIFSSSWIPQVDVLFDNRTVLFFSHGGLKSVKEATCSSTPAVFMPMFAEQGFAKVFSKHDLTAENLRKTMKLVLENKSFSKNAARIATLFNDKVVHPLVQGAHHMNRLLRYGGRMPEYFYPRAIGRDYFSYLNLDLFVVPVVFVALASY
ncbi:hypothetical protein ANCCEY_14135 [Ancylostoma ceylanicum]|uniref:glucuronosyltransferase n=1 Tax=Ancylostoma ceylanicum TaxID=53326 RepID=A0A0D6L634_9BILA|nr:hypothetical protein ANCCEY_14135 [Ancylostoma ceylanicum]